MSKGPNPKKIDLYLLFTTSSIDMLSQDSGVVMAKHTISSTHPYPSTRKKTGYRDFVSCALTALASAHFFG